MSFWYLYNHNKCLKAMVLEVNNTFDERRPYFLRRPTETSENDSMLRATWPKDFHVSPFHSRDGSYSLLAADPLADSSGRISINNNITLKSSEGPVKLVASVFSTGNVIDPQKMTTWSTFLFLASWWWVGLNTYPRIVREAGKLFMKRKMGVKLYFRPEINQETSVPREETATER